MTRKKNRLLELGKDLLIVALTLCAVYLLLRTQVSDNLSGGWLGAVMEFIDHGPAPARPQSGSEKIQPVKAYPLRMAVNIAGVGRYGVQYDRAGTEKLFDEVFAILGEALGSAEEPGKVTEQVWREALSDQSGIYFDFQGQVPMGALYTWLEAGPDKALAGERARRVLLAEDEDGALVLYYSDENAGLYYACQTAENLNGHLQNAVAGYAPSVNGVAFAYEKERGGGYEGLAPYVMLPGTPVMARGAYRVSNPIGGGQTDPERGGMIEALGFHPQPNTSYIAGGKQVVREGGDTLDIYDDGAVDFHSASAEEVRYPVGGGGAPTALEVMEVTQRLAEGTVGAWCGDARLYLMEITALEDGRWQADYGYHLNGAAVQLGSEGYAARFIVSGGRVSDFYLVMRTYAATGEQTAVLPELQAAAAMSALEAKGRELSLVYEESGSAETVRAGWIAEH